MGEGSSSPPKPAPFPPALAGRWGWHSEGRKSRRAQASQRVAVQLPSASPTPPPSLGSCGGEPEAERDGVGTHRPKLPVWASCRMRCSCLFIILGEDWRLQGHGRGRGPAAPGPACLCLQRFRPGWVGGALRFLGQRAPARSRLPARGSAPGPQVTPLSKFEISLSQSSGTPTALGPSPRKSVGRPPGCPQVVCAAPPRPPRPVPVAGSR